MGMEFEKLKKKFPTDQPTLEKQGRVRGNKNIFKVGLIFNHQTVTHKFVSFIVQREFTVLCRSPGTKVPSVPRHGN